ncbi:hypothetical protein ES702_06597 [subsurface metagenome]
MQGTKEALLIINIIWDKCEYYKSHYINPSQETWLKWLRNQGGLEVSRRTINRYFRAAENRIQITRIRRVKHHPIKGMLFLTTLYSVSYTGLMLLYQTGRITWPQLKKYLKNAIPFKARVPKKPKKGLSPGEPGFLKDWTSYGEKLIEPG